MTTPAFGELRSRPKRRKTNAPGGAGTPAPALTEANLSRRSDMTADRPINSTNPCCHHDQNANPQKIDLNLVENDPCVQRAASRALRSFDAQNILRDLTRPKINQKDLAERLGVSAAMVNFWLRGQRTPSESRMEALRKIAREFGV